MVDPSELLAYDRQHVWPPYGQLPNSEPRYCVSHASGVHLTLADGRKLIDGMSSWWSTLLGYGHPELLAAAHAQLDKMPHVMFGGLTHAPAIQLAEALLARAPKGLEQVFYCDSGSVSVEVAMKMARQVFAARHPGTPQGKFLCLRGGYHGDTWGALSVCDPNLSMHSVYAGALASPIYAPRPKAIFGSSAPREDLAELRSLIRNHAHELCAVILEPIVQGTGGMNFYSADYLKAIRALCTESNVLLIADEIATGFGRTGKLFACEHAGISPDILCVGKALTGGTLSFAATLTTSEVGRAISESDAGCFLHGPTFMGNPLACATALKTLQVLDELNWKSRVGEIEKRLLEELLPCRQSPHVKDVRALGAIGVVEMREPLKLATIVPRLVDQGVWLRPFGRLLYTMPPYTIEASELNQLCAAMRDIALAP